MIFARVLSIGAGASRPRRLAKSSVHAAADHSASSIFPSIVTASGARAHRYTGGAGAGVVVATAKTIPSNACVIAEVIYEPATPDEIHRAPPARFHNIRQRCRPALPAQIRAHPPQRRTSRTRARQHRQIPR